MQGEDRRGPDERSACLGRALPKLPHDSTGASSSYDVTCSMYDMRRTKKTNREINGHQTRRHSFDGGETNDTPKKTKKIPGRKSSCTRRNPLKSQTATSTSRYFFFSGSRTQQTLRRVSPSPPVPLFDTRDHLQQTKLEWESDTKNRHPLHF